MPLWTQAFKVIQCWPAIRSEAVRAKVGRVFKVSPTSLKIEDITARYL